MHSPPKPAKSPGSYRSWQLTLIGLLLVGGLLLVEVGLWMLLAGGEHAGRWVAGGSLLIVLGAVSARLLRPSEPPST